MFFVILAQWATFEKKIFEEHQESSRCYCWIIFFFFYSRSGCQRYYFGVIERRRLLEPRVYRADPRMWIDKPIITPNVFNFYFLSTGV
jgi:hypothetical protein